MKNILNATGPDVVKEPKECHRQQMLGFLDGHVADVRQSNVVIGFKVEARTDNLWASGLCPRAAQLEGVYLPDELPDLYPEDCPIEEFCCCTLYNTVLSCDDTPESRFLRQKMAERGLPEPPPPWGPIKPITEEERAEMVEIAKTALEVEPKKNRDVWLFILGLFSKK